MEKKSPSNNKAALIRYIVIPLALLAALLYGRSRSELDISSFVTDAFPRAEKITPSDGLHVVRSADGELLGFAATGSAYGYGGPLVMAIALDGEGLVEAARVIDHRETPVFYQRIKAPELLGEFSGRAFGDLDFDFIGIDGVTGATRSAKALAGAMEQAVYTIATDRFGAAWPEQAHPLEIGLFEIALVLIFIAGIALPGSQKGFRKYLCWGCRIAGLLIVGFSVNAPLTLARVSAFLSGYFPRVEANLVLYILSAGFVLPLLFQGRSVYCTHICPFGTAQRIFNLISGKRWAIPPHLASIMTLCRNILVFLAVLMALALVNPTMATYEPYAVLFAFRGTNLQWILMAVVLLVSLIVYRPWCRFLCPMRSCAAVLLDMKKRIQWITKGKSHA